MKKKFKITNNNNNNNLNSDSKDNISKIKPEKIKENENYISYNILNLILSKSNIPKTVIEEINSELYYETLTGKGLITFINNLKYEGYIKNGILQSQNEESTLTFKDGTIYTGEIKNNKISGKGKYFFPTGSTYIGEVLNGYRNGKGIYNTIEGISYEGEWKNGLKHGKGKMINNEIIYDGDWYNGNMYVMGAANDKNRQAVRVTLQEEDLPPKVMMSDTKYGIMKVRNNADGSFSFYDVELDVSTGAILQKQDNRWLDVQGRLLKGKPTTKGRYLHNGKMVIIK